MRRTDGPRGRDVAAGMFLKRHQEPLPLPRALISSPPPPSSAADAAEGAAFGGRKQLVSQRGKGVLANIRAVPRPLLTMIQTSVLHRPRGAGALCSPPRLSPSALWSARPSYVTLTR